MIGLRERGSRLLPRDQSKAVELMQELWLPVPGWERFYRVSNHGNAESLGRMTDRKSPSGVPYQRWIDGRRLKLSRNNVGYYWVHLSDDGRKKSVKIAHLVMAAFVGPRPEGLQVAHLDGNKANNRLDNLQYKTPAANALDRITHGTSGKGEKNSQAKLSDQERYEIQRLYHFDSTPVAVIAEAFGISFQHVYKIVNSES